jgi:hypothetical protein
MRAGVIWTLGLVGALYLALASEPKGTGYVTIYVHVCQKDNEADYTACAKTNSPKWTLAHRYKVDFERQRVFSLLTWPDRYDSCVVIDTQNWTCKNSSGAGSISIIEGRFFDSRGGFAIEQISWLKYMIEQWT